MRTVKDGIDFSTILFLRMAMDMPDETRYEVIAKMHDEFIDKHKISIWYTSKIKKSNSRIQRIVARLRKAGLIIGSTLTLHPPTVNMFWEYSGMSMNNWKTWALEIPFKNNQLDFQNILFEKSKGSSSLKEL